jgi:hypothetical protein
VWIVPELHATDEGRQGRGSKTETRERLLKIRSRYGFFRRIRVLEPILPTTFRSSFQHYFRRFCFGSLRWRFMSPFFADALADGRSIAILQFVKSVNRHSSHGSWPRRRRNPWSWLCASVYQPAMSPFALIFLSPVPRPPAAFGSSCVVKRPLQ